MSNLKQNVGQAVKVLRNTGFFSIAGSTVINKIIVFFSGVLIVRLLSKEDYGVYAYAYNLLNIALLFNGLGSQSGLIQLCCETGNSEKARLFESYGYIVGVVFDCFLVVCFSVYALYLPETLPGSRLLLMVCSLIPIPQLVFELQCATLRAQLRNNEYALANMMNTLCIATSTVIGSFMFGAMGLLVGRIIALFVSIISLRRRFAVPSFYITHRFTNVSEQLTKADKVEFLKISASSMLANGISSFTYLIGTFMIGRLTQSSVEVASYEAASAIPIALNFIPSAIMTYVYPFFARNKDDAHWVCRHYILLTLLGFVVFGLVALSGVIIAPYLIQFVYGKAYLDSVAAFRVLMIGFWLGATFRSLSGGLLATQHLVVSNIISAAVSVSIIFSLNWILVPRVGFIGSAFAQAIGLIIAGMINTASFLRKVFK